MNRLADDVARASGLIDRTFGAQHPHEVDKLEAAVLAMESENPGLLFRVATAAVPTDVAAVATRMLCEKLAKLSRTHAYGVAMAVDDVLDENGNSLRVPRDVYEAECTRSDNLQKKLDLFSGSAADSDDSGPSPAIFKTSTDAMQKCERIVVQAPDAKFVIQWDAQEQHLIVFLDNDASLCIHPVACNGVALQAEPWGDTYD